MKLIFIVTQIFVCTSLIGIILLQKGDGNALGGLGGANNNIMSGRTASNLLTKITNFLAICFFINTIILVRLFIIDNKSSIVDEIKSNVNGEKQIIQDLHPANGRDLSAPIAE